MPLWSPTSLDPNPNWHLINRLSKGVTLIFSVHLSFLSRPQVNKLITSIQQSCCFLLFSSHGSFQSWSGILFYKYGHILSDFKHQEKSVGHITKLIWWMTIVLYVCYDLSVLRWTQEQMVMHLSVTAPDESPPCHTF